MQYQASDRQARVQEVGEATIFFLVGVAIGDGAVQVEIVGW
jgi:hypothetical protein